MRHIKLLSLIFFFILLTGCGKENEEISIGEQYGLAYAPLQIMKSNGYLEAALPHVDVKWQKVSNTIATREAILSNNLDVGFIGIPPFLIGADKGMPWKIISGLSQSPLGLVTNSEEINNLSDLVENGKIALPQPGSIQHILLSMAAEKQLDNSRVFDSQLVSMKHPDGYQSLKSGNDISAHFTSPPYLFQELDEPNNKLLLSGSDAMGDDFTFIIGICTDSFKEKKEYYAAFKDSLQKSIDFINTEKESSIKILSAAYDLPEDVIEDYIYNREMKYSSEIKGVDKFIDFMFKEEYLETKFKSGDLIWE